METFEEDGDMRGLESVSSAQWKEVLAGFQPDAKFIALMEDYTGDVDVEERVAVTIHV